MPQDEKHTGALLKWVDAQPALPAPSQLDAVAVQRGEALFTGAAGCASCHSGPQGTNNANATVGTGESLQVPRLVELAYRAPFFHDGRVPTLAARFTDLGGGEQHGHTSQLSAQEVADLVSYLKSR
jgi:mono/diheme cytochrome c family protein